MDQLSVSILICVLQVSIIAFIGLLTAAFLVRFRPTLATSVVYPCVIVIVILSVMLLVPTPGWFAADGIALPAPTAGTQPRESEAAAGDVSRQQESARQPPVFTVSAGLNSLREGFQEFTAIARRQHSPHWRPVLWVMLIICLFSSLRFVLGIRFAAGLVREGRPVTDPAVLEVMDAIRQQLCSKHEVTLIESDRIASAAVSGWPSAVVLLPADWRHWNQAQLRSVLAHELSHVGRHDFLWRVATGLTAALHSYNPVVHLLMRRIALIQEINADICAAKVVGPETYVRALSALALQRDDRDEFSARAGHCPVFSGYLIRRIRMLITKKDWKSDGRQTIARAACAAAVVAAGMLLFVAGGFAQPPDKKTPSPKKETVRVVSLTGTEIDRTGTKADPTDGMFLRKRMDLATVPENKGGFFTCRIADICSATDSAEVIEVINQFAAVELMKQLGSPEQPDFDLSVAEVILGTAQFQLRHDPEKEEHKNTMSFGASDFCVQMTRTVNIADWVSRFAPESETTTRDGHDYFTLPAFPVFGPYPIVIADKDPDNLSPTNIFIRPTEPDTIDHVVTAVTHQNKLNQSPWTNVFEQVDGGLLSFAATDKDITIGDDIDLTSEDVDDSERLASQALLRIAKATTSFAVGLDLTEDADRIGVRFRVVCSGQGSVGAIESDLRQLLRLAKEEFFATEAGTSEDEIAEIVAKQLIEHLVVDVTKNADGATEVDLRSVCDFPPITGRMAAQSLREGLEATNE